jgi:hypothetical protein
LKKTSQRLFAQFRCSRRALAIPVTFLILFVSTLGLISATYYFAVERVNSQSQTLKISTAKQNFLALDENVMSVIWQPGSARSFEVSNVGGKLCVQPNITSLQISITDNQNFNETVFNQITGQIIYELPYSESSETGLFLKGDSRTITNQSGSIITQLSIERGADHPEMQLRYRPTVSYYLAGTENGKPVNKLRIYVVNMNDSDSIALYGKLPLRISCESIQVTSSSYNVATALENLVITSSLNGASGKVLVPISSTPSGVVINVEIVQCNIKVERSVL